MSRSVGVPCLKCGASATVETADSDEPLCWVHGGGEPEDVEAIGELNTTQRRALDEEQARNLDDFLTHEHSDERGD